MNAPQNNSWWGPHTLDLHQTAYFQIGPFQLWISRHASEWRLAWVRLDEPMSHTLIHGDLAHEGPPSDAETARIGVEQTAAEYALSPILANLPYVFDTETPYFLPAGEKSRLYMSSPIRVRFHIKRGGPPSWDEPIMQSSETWFGPSTRQGRICYASKTRALTSLDGQVSYPHRAQSVVSIHNKAKTVLTVAKLMLPMPKLSLYSDGNRFWTQNTGLVREQHGELAKLTVNAIPPNEAKLVAGPQEPLGELEIMRVFGGLFK